MYTEAEAARLLRLSQSTLNWWLEGKTYRGRHYDPVLRPEATGERIVTWAEFIEAGLLRQYRQDLRVALRQLRKFIEIAREKWNTPYPLAHYLPYVGPGRELLLEVQEEAALPANLWLVAPISGQTLLTLPGAEFYRRVLWEGNEPAAWKPGDHDASTVTISPLVRFGKPAVQGVSTEVLWEQLDEGASIEEVADDFDLSVDDVRWAQIYELSNRAAA